jgi:hypothetical protein
MPVQKDFKRLVRSRMQKTGESYTAARSQLLKRGRRIPAPPAAAAPSATPATAATSAPADFARLAGMSDEAVKAKTGCDWSRWVWALDRLKAYEMPHREIARIVHEKYKVPGWWTQTVTVGYERIKGLREIGQRRNGAYEANKSMTIGAPVSRVFRAFKDARTRARWLPAPVTVRTATPNKTMRLSWDDGTVVSLYFTAKGAGKSQVAVQHLKVPSRARATELKAFWGERLAALAQVVRS